MPKIYLSPSNQDNNVGYGNYGTEKSRMIQIAEVVKKELERNFEVKMANYDSKIELRTAESNTWGSDIYVAIHSNAGGGRGCEIYAYSKTSKGNTLANLIYKQMEAITPSSDRGIKYSSLYETRKPACPAVLIETAFHDNKEDAEWIINNIDLIGKTIAKGIYEYFGVDYSTSIITPIVMPSNNSKEEFEVKTYKNGSSVEPVYQDTAKKVKIGSLDKYETCECYGKVNGMYIVAYKVNGTNYKKVGYVAYNGGIE